MDPIISINPATGKSFQQFKPYDEGRIDQVVKRARLAFEDWRNLDVSERSKYLINVASVMRDRKHDLGEMITREMGKPIKQSVPEVEKCAQMFEYFAKNAEQLLEPEAVEGDLPSSSISFEPMGTVLCIKPWNFPFWQVLSAASHVLAGGNVVLLKHSSYVPGCALGIESIFAEAGLPEDIFQTLLIDGPTASGLIGRDGIDAVSFTGGLQAGRMVAEAAARNMKKCVCELGGSDPFIVLEDANLKEAAKVAAAGRFINAGQTCIASKRFIVADTIAEEFTSRFVEQTRDMVIGDPLDPNTDIGPLVREGSITMLEGQVRDAVAKGAGVALEGGRIPGPGYLFLPVILSGVTRDMKVMREETFGPVAPIITVRDEDEAIRCANDTDFGLGASIWSEDQDRVRRLAGDIQAGVVGVNGFFTPQADLPFGGVKKSGVGRELSHFGFYEFMNIKATKIY
ncbi:MAG: NAD-dependent succinate-semialdehyde dehydrogenase [Euryarchaeota archaeon]|nr:NAD-dependent succinate-semialdehyde dehydrogenase [Euryarchaeota archaeon]